ncbi:MAG: hypothetical protein H6600_03410 [Flavobacteriales bacterium]|nr:hypothetical protein [Flavobacteriales bacterium]MCB9197480.1 hypothetical protein [Flavobacteriales bacterium]
MNENSTLKTKVNSETNRCNDQNEKLQPKESIVASLLNYSKSLNFKSSKLVGQIELTLS